MTTFARQFILFCMRFLCLTIPAVLLTLTVQAQVKFGFMGTPTLTFPKVSVRSEQFEVSSGGGGIGYQWGLFSDYFFTENYAVHTGLFFSSKKAQYRFKTLSDPSAQQQEKKYAIGYLHVPTMLKLYTDELLPDFRVYFRAGLGWDFRVSEQELSDDKSLESPNFSAFDILVCFSAAAEYRISLNTSVFIGIGFQRGLLDVDFPLESGLQGEVDAHHQMFLLDLGIRL